MTQSVELLLDAEADAAVRADWAVLLEAGHPSQGRNSAPTTRPHTTLWAGASLSEPAEDALGALTPAMPIPLRLGAVACFGRRRFILVRLVVTSVRLLELQASVAETCGFDDGSTLAPGHWTPHVTLARGLTAAQVGAALDVLNGPRERDTYAVGWRRWDGDARREWDLPAHSLG
ncbi:MAG: 2'-5' RNA ligase family protein [Actinomycetia bacterium]|nr:2'-5' RNA ligase family protein [Actinomycetes bacterium]